MSSCYDDCVIIFKKLFFAIPFLICFAIFLNSSKNLQDYNLIWSFSPDVFINTLMALLALLLSSFFFVVFVALSNDFKYSLPVILLASLLSFLFLDISNAFIFMIGTFLTFGLENFLLSQKLKTYLTFQASNLLGGNIAQSITLILLVFSLTFYLNTDQSIKQNGFKIPDSLINTSLSLAQGQMSETNLTDNFQIPADQLALLKQNPELLKQYGLDPSILDTVSNSGKSAPQNLLKATVESQVQKFIEPYKSYLPLILTILVFLSLKSVASLLSIFTPFVLWFTFWLLGKIGFTKYQVEQREVKKLVV